MSIRKRYAVLLLVFVVLGVYYPCIFSGSSSLDDRRMLVDLLNRETFDLKGIFLPGGTASYYRPLLFATFVADRFLWGLQESFMHLENLLLHLFCVLLVYLLALRLVRGAAAGGAGLAFSAALLFGLHPVNTESVNWISGRTDLLAGFFFLLTLLLLLGFLDSGRRLELATAVSAFFLGCLSKEVTLFAYPALIFLVYCHRRSSCDHPLRRSVEPALWLSVAVLGYFGLRIMAFGKGESGVAQATAALASAPAGGAGNLLFAKFAFVCRLFGFYTKKLFVPWPLNLAIVDIAPGYLYLGIAVLLLGGYLLFRRDLVGAFLVTSLCLISSALIIAMSTIAWTPYAERYLYLASAPFAAAIVCAGYSFGERVGAGRWLPALVTPLLIVCGLSTLQRNLLWQDNLKLFQDTVRKSPGFLLAKNELAIALQERGRHEEARAIFAENGLGQSGKYLKVVEANRAALLMRQGDLEGARALLAKALDPKSGTYPSLLNQLVKVHEGLLRRAKDPVEKKRLLAELVALLNQLQRRTGDPFQFYRIGQAYLGAGEKKLAVPYFEKAYRLAPEQAYYRLPAQKLALKLAL